jgi:hypothetical protein
VKKLWLLLALLFLVDPHAMANPQSVPAQQPNSNNVRYAKSFAGATPDAKIAACLADLGVLPGTCYTDGVTGTFAATLTMSKPFQKLAVGPGTLDFGSVNPGIRISADNVSVIGAGRGRAILKQDSLYHIGIFISTASGAAPSNITITGLTIQGPSTYASGTVNTSGTDVTWASGSQFNPQWAATITIGTPAVQYKVARVTDATHLVLASSAGTQWGAGYYVGWDVNGTVGIACHGCSNSRITDNELTGWGHVAIGLGESSYGPSYSVGNHNTISENWIHDNPGEGMVHFFSNHSVPWPDGYNVEVDNHFDNNGLSAVDIATNHNTFRGNILRNNACENKTGDASSVQVIGSYNFLEGNIILGGNQWNVAIGGSHNDLSHNVIDGATGAIGATLGQAGRWGHGIQIAAIGIGWPANNNHVSHNHVWNNAGYGIVMGAPSLGTVNTSGASISRASGAYFNTSWASETLVNVNGVVYAIARVTSPTEMTLTTSAGTQNGVKYGGVTDGTILVANDVEYNGVGSIEGGIFNGGVSATNPVYVANRVVNNANFQIGGYGRQFVSGDQTAPGSSAFPIINPSSSGNISLAGPSTSERVTPDTAPTCTVSGGASEGFGSGATCVVAAGSNDNAGVIYSQATAAPGSSGTVTLTFHTTFGTHYSACSYSLANSTGSWNARASTTPTNNSNSTLSAAWDNNGVALAVGSYYGINYNCPGN